MHMTMVIQTGVCRVDVSRGHGVHRELHEARIF